MLTTTPDDVRSDLADAGYADLTVRNEEDEVMILVTDSGGEFWESEREAEVFRKCVEKKVDLGEDETELVRKPGEGYESRYQEAVKDEEMVWAVAVVEFAISDLLGNALASIDAE
jgi:hypothetical protein